MDHHRVAPLLEGDTYCFAYAYVMEVRVSVWRSKDVRTLRSLVMDLVVVHQITKEQCLRNPFKNWLANNACKILVCQQERGVPTEMPMSLAYSVSCIF